MKSRPQVGIGVLIFRENKILLGKRIASHGSNTWSPPGGHLEFGESFESCARREVLEETGLLLGQIEQGPITNDIFEESSKHYVTIFMQAIYCGGQPQVLEPEKCLEWNWFELDTLPQPLFLPLQNLIKMLQKENKLLKNLI